MASHLGSWELDIRTRGRAIFICGGFGAAVIMLQREYRLVCPFATPFLGCREEWRNGQGGFVARGGYFAGVAAACWNFASKSSGRNGFPRAKPRGV